MAPTARAALRAHRLSPVESAGPSEPTPTGSFVPIARSFLFVPGNRPDLYEKAYASEAHAVIVDLEDAVGPDDKEGAREAAAAWLDSSHAVLLRINAAGSEWFEEDLALVGLSGVSAVVLPKVEAVEDVRRVGERTRPEVPVLPLIESAMGLHGAMDIAREPSVQRLLFGALDLQHDLGIAGDGEELHTFRSHLVLVSRLAGIQPPVDGVWTDFHDEEGLRAHTLRGRRFGFGGTLCIHPSQVGPVNDCFLPSQEEIDWAKRVLDAVASSGGSVVALDGQMIDRPLILMAERILCDVEEPSS